MVGASVFSNAVLVDNGVSLGRSLSAIGTVVIRSRLSVEACVNFGSARVNNFGPCLGMFSRLGSSASIAARVSRFGGSCNSDPQRFLTQRLSWLGSCLSAVFAVQVGGSLSVLDLQARFRS